jgi:hypothetical protein
LMFVPIICAGKYHNDNLQARHRMHRSEPQ